jgi:hypothetical protein
MNVTNGNDGEHGRKCWHFELQEFKLKPNKLPFNFLLEPVPRDFDYFFVLLENYDYVESNNNKEIVRWSFYLFITRTKQQQQNLK